MKPRKKRKHAASTSEEAFKRDLYACYINSSDQASFFRLPVTVYRQGTVKPVVLSPFPSAPV